MISLYNINGLVFWTEREILIRKQLEQMFALEVHSILSDQNPAWRIFQIEAPIMTPVELLNPAYASDDVFMIDVFMKQNIYLVNNGEGRGFSLKPMEFIGIDTHRKPLRECVELVNGSNLMLRPETTAGSYAYAKHLLETHSGIKPPFIVWQAGKSFRKEQDQATKNMRLKEFYQQEFQCIYSADTKNDYFVKTLGDIGDMIANAVGGEFRVLKSDRLPSYSTKTIDIEAVIGDRSMELCSISDRTDFPIQYNGKDLRVLEIAIGLDRCVYVKSLRDLNE